MIREVLSHIAENYGQARMESISAHPMASYLSTGAPNAIGSALGTENSDLIVKGSAGKGNWTDVPWIAIFDPIVTTSAQRGYYPVYLFARNLRRVFLSLNQGATNVKDEFKRDAAKILQQRADLMRTRVKALVGSASTAEIKLYSDALPRFYEPGHALGFEYDTSDLPSEERLSQDLAEIVNLYRNLTLRGGLMPSGEIPSDEIEETNLSIEELLKYGLHRRIERSASVSKDVKKVRGYICDGCDFDFEKTYGPVGKKYIEAHHLTPISELPVGKRVMLDAKTDFVVLCANCHRMMHRKDGPRTLADLKAVLV